MHQVRGNGRQGKDTYDGAALADHSRAKTDGAVHAAAAVDKGGLGEAMMRVLGEEPPE